MVEHVAVQPAQVVAMGLVANSGKATDSRAKGFVARHGALVQVEVEAIAPNDLRNLYLTAIESWWDDSTFDAVFEQEEAERKRLRRSAQGYRRRS